MATIEKNLGFKLSIADKTLTITKAFEEAVASGSKEECELFNRLMRDIPDLKVIRKTHATPRRYTNKSGEETSRNQFKNLTYQNMEKFIKAIPNNEEYLTEYTFARETASRLQINGYTLIRRWFVAQFPLYRKNPLFYLRNQPELILITDIQKQMEEDLEENKTDAVVNF